MKPLQFLLNLLLILSIPLGAQAAPEVIYKDKAGRVLTRNDLKDLNDTFKWEILQTTPVSNDAMRLHELGRAAGQKGDSASALRHFEAAARAEPRWPYPVYDAAFTYLLQKDFPQAREFYRRVDAMAPRGFFTVKTAVHTLDLEQRGKLPPGTYLQFVSLEWMNDKNRVKQAALDMTVHIPNFAPAWKTAALLEPDLAKRRALLEKGLSAAPDLETRGFLLLNKAAVLMQQGDKAAALQIVGDLALDPSSPADIEALAKQSVALMVSK
ncbi:tetratricopeptide repeat protein [Variovorax boronicumulans]